MFTKHFLRLPIATACFFVILFQLLTSDAADAQSTMPADNTNQPVSQTLFQQLAGRPAPDTIYLGLWSVHIIDDDEEYTNTHDLFGIVYKGFF